MRQRDGGGCRRREYYNNTASRRARPPAQFPFARLARFRPALYYILTRARCRHCVYDDDRPFFNFFFFIQFISLFSVVFCRRLHGRDRVPARRIIISSFL